MRKHLFLLICLAFSSSLIAKPIVSGDLNKGNFKLQAGNLGEIISQQMPMCDEVLVIGKDGTAVLIPAYAFDYVTIEVITDIWSIIGGDLPPVTNIRDFAEICLKQFPAPYSIKLISSKVSTITPFDFRLAQFDFLGESEKNGFVMRKYKEKDLIINHLDLPVSQITMRSGETISSFEGKIRFKQFYFEAKSDTIVSIDIRGKE